MRERIKRGSIVSIKPSFIEEFGRTELRSDDIWKVLNVVPVCGDKKVANMVNAETNSKLDLFTCNLILI